MGVDDNADLLLRIQSDVADGVQGLQQAGGQLANLLNIALDTNKVLREMNLSATAAQRGVESVGRAADGGAAGFGRWQRSIITVNQALGLGQQVYRGAIGLIDTLVVSTLREADALDKLSTRTGIHSQVLSSYSLALRQANTDVSALGGAIELFERKLQTADKGDGAFGRFIQKNFGRSAQDLLKDPDKLVDRIADVMQRASAEQRSTVSGALFGPRAKELTPFFALGAENIRKTQQEMREVGAIMGQDFVRNAAKATDEIERLKVTFDGVRIAVAQQFFPVFNQNLQKLLGWLRSHQQELSDGLAKWLTKSADALEKAVPLAQTLAGSIGQVAGVGLDPNSALGKIVWLAAEHPLIAYGFFRGGVQGAAIGGLVEAVANPSGNPSEKLVGGDPPAGAPMVGGWTAADAEYWKTYEQVQANEARRRYAQSAFGRADVGRLPYPGAEARLAALKDQGASRAAQARLVTEALTGTGEMSLAGGFGGWEGLGTQAAGLWGDADSGGGVDTSDLTSKAAAAAQLAQAQIQSALAVKDALIDVEQAKWKTLLDLNEIEQVDYLKKEREFALQRIAIQEDAARQELAVATDPSAKATAQGQLDALAAQGRAVDADYAGKIAVAERDRADQLRQTYTEVAQLSAKAFGSERQQQILQLASSWEQMVERLRRSGMEQYIGDVNAAYEKLLQDADSITINIGQTLRQGIGDAFVGTVLGTREPEDLLQGFTQALEAKWADMFGAMIEEKLNFDLHIKKNFLEDIPGMAAEGADKVGGVFSGLWSWLTGDDKRESPHIDAQTGLGSGALRDGSPGAVRRLFGGEGSGAAPSPPVPETREYVVRSDNPNLAPGTLVERTPDGGYRIVSPPPGGAAPGGSFTDVVAGSSSTAPSAGAATGGGGFSGAAAMAGYMAIAMAAIGALTSAAKAFKEKRWEIGIGQQGMLSEMAGSAVEGSLSAIGLGGLGSPLGKAATSLGRGGGFGRWAVNTTLVSPLLTGGIPDPMLGLFADDIFAAMGLFQPKSTGTILKKGLSGMLGEAGLPQQHAVKAGGHWGVRVPGMEVAVTEEQRQRFVDMGFAHPGALQKNNPLYRPLREAAAANPEVDQMRFGSALGLAAALAPNRRYASQLSNALANNFLLEGLSAEEARRQLHALADSQGVDLQSGLQKMQKNYIERRGYEDNKQTPQNEALDALKADVANFVAVFKDDLPAAIDISAIATKHFSEAAGIDIAALNKELERTLTIYQGLGVKEGVSAALTTRGRAPQAFQASIRENFKKTALDQMTQAIAENDQLEALFAPANDTIGKAVDLMRSGDAAGANKLLKEAGDAMKTAYEEGGKLVDQLLAGTPELKTIIEDMQAAAQATDALRAGLESALIPLTDPNRDLQEQERERRIESLKRSIELAREFGDEINAVELEQALASEEAAQRLEGTAGSGDRFARALKAKIKEQVVQGVIEGILATSILTNPLKEFIEQTINPAVKDLAAHPENAADIMATIRAGGEALAAAIKPLFDIVNTLAPALAPALQFADGGVVPGPRAQAVLATLHGGEMVLNAGHQAGLLNALQGMQVAGLAGDVELPGNGYARLHTLRSVYAQAPRIGAGGRDLARAGETWGGGHTVQVFVSGNTLMGNTDIDRLANRVAEAAMDGLKKQQPIVHRR